MNTPCCAHSKVVLKHNEYPDGTRSDYWECDSGCGKRFFPEHVDLSIRNLRNAFAAAALPAVIEELARNSTNFEGLYLRDMQANIVSIAFGIADKAVAESNKTPKV